jgi:RNA polymerase sigma factor (sigma-70 family)
MTETEHAERQDFEALVRRHQAQVCAVAYAVVHDRALAQEVAQDAFLIAWRGRASTVPSVRWICGIARNHARNIARRRREAPMTDDPATSALDPRDELITRENAAHAEAALARLPQRYREAVVLYYGGDESIADVASALGISQDSARQRVHRGRERLRELVATVETALRATRPTGAFTAACVAAWTAGKPTAAHAARVVKRPHVSPRAAGSVGVPVGVAVAVALAVVAVAASVVVAVGVTGARTDATRVTTDPRAVLYRRYPMSPRLVLPRDLPARAVALVASPSITSPAIASNAAPASPVVAAKVVELDFHMAPFVDLMQLFRNVLDVPIWVAYDTDVQLDVDTHGKQAAIDVLDEVLDKAHANRAEVAAIRVVPGGRTDAGTLGGEVVSLSVRNAPLNHVLDVLEPKLGMPIGRLGPEAIPGTVNEDGTPIVDASPVVTLELHEVPAGVALEEALTQAGVGYELTTGFVILPQ